MILIMNVALLYLLFKLLVMLSLKLGINIKSDYSSLFRFINVHILIFHYYLVKLTLNFFLQVCYKIHIRVPSKIDPNRKTLKQNIIRMSKTNNKDEY